MADLIDRISGDSLPARPKINIHRWIGAQRLYALGEFTRAQLATEFDLQAPDETRQGGQIADAIDAQSNATQKMIYIGRVEAVFYCLEDNQDRLYHDVSGNVVKATAFADLQIAG